VLVSQVIATDIANDFTPSVATTDDLLSPIVNPAALGFGNSRGMGFLNVWDKEKLQNHYWYIANLEGLSYVYENIDDKINTHTFAMGSELTGAYKIPNLYGGTSYKWINNKTNEGAFKSGLMYRPLDFSSIGFVWNNPYQQAPNYQFGIGVRPLAFVPQIKDHRMELSVDYDYSKDTDGKYALSKPILGAGLEIIDGIKIKGNYNLETETSSLNFSLSAKKMQLGSLINTADDSYNLAYYFVSDKNFLPFAGVEPKKWYALPTKSQVVTYKAPQYSFGPFKIFDDKQISVEEIINNIKQAASDPAISGIVFVNKNFLASMALKQEIIAEIKQFKSTGKKVVFYYDNMSNGDYVFAAAIADKIYLNPQGSIDLKGIAVNSPYVKDALDKLGIEVMNFRSHAYKTAGNMFSESEMTKEERAEYEMILSSLYSQMCDMIKDGRGDKLAKSVTQTIDEGPYYDAQEALKAGLVDELVYESEFNALLKKDFKTASVAKTLDSYQNYDWSHAKKSKIAIIYAQGNIVMGKGDAGKKIAHATTVEMIRKARKNPEIKGIILRVDSGGGSAQASDIIHREIELAKKENKKPIVVSMTGVAGSGGYYISCNSDYIYADPATITGSIGVIGIAFNAEELFDKIHVNWSTVKKGKNSDFGNFSRKWTNDEKDIMQRLIASSYSDFVSKVAKGRNREFAQIDSVAQGKIWTGTQAKEIGLIDDLGGLKEAIAKVKQLANINHDVELVNFSKSGNSVELSVGLSAQALLFPSIYQNPVVSKYIQLYDNWQAYGTEKTLFLSEMDLEQLTNN
jgi:protease-4